MTSHLNTLCIKSYGLTHFHPKFVTWTCPALNLEQSVTKVWGCENEIVKVANNQARKQGHLILMATASCEVISTLRVSTHTYTSSLFNSKCQTEGYLSFPPCGYFHFFSRD